MATTLSITCETCCRNERKIAQQLQRLNQLKTETGDNSKLNKCEVKIQLQHLRGLKQKHTKLQEEIERKIILPMKRCAQTNNEIT